MRHPAIIVACGLILLQLLVEPSFPQDVTNPQQILSRAVELHQRGDLEGAIRQYRAFLARFPNVADVRFNLGAALAAAGQYREAISEYERALELGGLSDPSTVQFNLAWACFQAAEIGKAKKALEKVLADRPSDRDAILLLAYCHLREGDSRKTLELLSPLETELKGDEQFGYVFGSALLESGQLNRAQAIALRLVAVHDSAEARLLLGRCRMDASDYFSAQKELERAVALDPKLPTLNSTYGILLRVMTRVEEADAAFQRELAIDPSDFDSNLYHGMYLQQNEQKYDEALACFNRALRAKPGDLSVLFQIGLAYEQVNRADEALETVKRIVRERPDFLEGHLTLARLYYRRGDRDAGDRHRLLAERLTALADGQQLIQKGQFEQALKLFNQQKQANPSDPEACFWAGMTLSHMGNWKAAATELEQAVRLDPRNPRYRIAEANVQARQGQTQLATATLSSLNDTQLGQLDATLAFLLADTYHRVGSHDKALRALQILAEKAPDDPRVDLFRGQIFLVQGKFDEARQSLTRSIQKQPANNAAAYSLLGAARYGLKDTAGAKNAFVEAVKQEPDNPEYLKKLGTLCLELGDYSEAVHYLERAKPEVRALPDIAQLLEKAKVAQKPQDW
jgi:tetratricopeptide (TPR) repeat protein